MTSASPDYAGRMPDGSTSSLSSDLDDLEITRRFVTGAPDALALVYRRWGGLVLALARRAVGPSDAEDITQQVFVSAWRSRENYDARQGELGGWLTGITRFRIADHLRSRVRAREISTDPQHLPRGHDQSGWTDQVATSLTVTEELARIGEPQATIVRLAYYQQLSHQHIADRTGLPVGTVKSHLSRTLRRLRDQLREDVGDGGEPDASRA